MIKIVYTFKLTRLLKRLFCTFFIVVLFGCGAGSMDFSEDLGNGYYYYNNSAIDRFIAPKNWNDKTPIIPLKVVQYKEKDGYIIAKRDIVQCGMSGSRVAIGEFDYWILDTSKKKVFGPMHKNDLNNHIAQLGLSIKISF